MDNLPGFVKSMVPVGIKKELKKIQNKSYNDVLATNVFTIGTNLLLTLVEDIDCFIIKQGKREVKIPFEEKDGRFNIQVNVVSKYKLKSGIYQLRVKKGKNHFAVKTIEDTVSLSGILNDISFQLKLIKEQLYIEILNPKDSNLYLLNKKVDLLPEINTKLLFANEHFMGIEPQNKININKVFFLNGFGKAIPIAFWESNQEITMQIDAAYNTNECDSNDLFYLMGEFKDEDDINRQFVFKVDNRNKNITLTQQDELDHVFTNQLNIYNKKYTFIHVSKEIEPWQLEENLQIRNNKIFIKVNDEKVNGVSSAECVVRKNGQSLGINVDIQNGYLIINGDDLKKMRSGYIIDLYVIDDKGYKHRLIDRNKKHLSDINRHYLLEHTEGTKTYVYYTKTGRVSIFRSPFPIEILKANFNYDYFEMKYDNRKLIFESDKKYEALLQTDKLTILELPSSYSNGQNMIDLTSVEFTSRKKYQILLKEEGNHNFNYVNAKINNINSSTDLMFNESDLSFYLKNQLKLSIIVTFYNTSKYLDRLFKSVLKQGLMPDEYEVLAINDSSTDNSRWIAEKYAGKYPQFRIIDHEYNKGVGEARNTGVKYARGKFIAFIDGDDFLKENAYKEMLNIITKTHSQLITGGAKRYHNNRIQISWMYRKIFKNSMEKIRLSEYPELVYDLSVWNKIYNREWFVANKFKFPSMLYEDVPVALSVFNTADSIDVYAEDMYYWFIRDQKGDESITNSRTDLNNFTDRMKAIRFGTKILRNNASAEFAYQEKVLSLDIPIYLRHFNHVTDQYREALSKEISWVLDNFMESAIQTLSNRDFERLKYTADGDFERLLELYEEGELAQ